MTQSPSVRRAWRALIAVAVAAAAGLVLAPFAQAHEGADFEIVAILDRVSPEMPGVTTRLRRPRSVPSSCWRTPLRPR